MREIIAPCLAMVLIAILLVIALLNEINGVLLSGGLAIIGGLGGFVVGKKVEKRKKDIINGSGTD